MAAALAGCCSSPQPEPAAGPSLPSAGQVLKFPERGEVLVHGKLVRPASGPCLDGWGQRNVAFLGCAQTAAAPAKYAEQFVFLIDSKTEEVHDALVAVGGTNSVHYAGADAKKRAGLRPDTKPDDYLQGDPVLIAISWKDGEKWRELSYDAFAMEKVAVEGGEVVKPWTPHFVFHGSGAIHATGTGCLACPNDCPGGIITDNRNPIADPKPVLKFDWTRAPAPGTEIYVRFRLIGTK
jgi:hypothetical protein